jgi:hypothetical protein
LEALGIKNINPIDAIEVSQSYLYERGLHNFQSYAKEKLEVTGIKNIDQIEAIGVYQSYLCERGFHNFQSYAKEKLEEAGIKNVDPINTNGVHQSYLYKQGLHNFQLHAKEQLEALGIKNVDPNNACGVYQSMIIKSDNQPMTDPVTASKSAKSQSKPWTENQEMTLRKLVSEKKALKGIRKTINIHDNRVTNNCVELKLDVWSDKYNSWVQLITAKDTPSAQTKRNREKKARLEKL